MFPKILIANRGEIAVRILRACKEMGILTVAVFSEADRDALHVSMADESYCIGGPQAFSSYLNQQALLSVALLSGARAIHPGYGFLSENAAFAEACEQHGLKFIGPSARVIRLMGDKEEAKRTMARLQVPTIPGQELLRDAQEAKEAAQRVGFPLLLKARAGGGGRGIRLVERPEDVEAAFRAASAEAQASFADGGLYMEKFLRQVKHVEMQILCDQQGHAVCLGERDCSMQRRNQKLIEESPCPVISQELRERMMATAARAATSLGYEGVGTLEFLLDGDRNFYFMEMNTRLQVEHPVTEMVTGIDLVKWQIRVAAGLELPFTQRDIALRGHAIECRINAEDPQANFRPSCGQVSLLHIPGGPWVRFDTALYQGYRVPPYYDSMIGKLIVYAATRQEAIRKMQAALCETVIEGVEHNGCFQADLICEPAFVDGSYATDFLRK